jgi:hypothetical protein
MRQPVMRTPYPRTHAPIQPQAVRAALDTLLYSAAARRFTPLEHLWLVDAFLLDPDNALNPDERLLALQTVLVDIITQELNRHRAAVHRAPASLHDDFATTMEHIGLDARTENIELIAWGWLYCRCVRVDLHVTPQVFCASAHCDERTRRRYHSHGVRRLTERLIERERDARQRLRKQRLYAALPLPFPTPLFGRGDLLAQARRWCAGEQPLLLQVIGAPGVGKTAFLTELLRADIDAGRINEIIWLDCPQSCDQVLERVTAALPPDALTVGSLPGIVLILDDLSLLEAELLALNRLLMALAPLTIGLIHQIALPIAPLSLQVHLDGLTLLETSALIRWLESRSVNKLNGASISDPEILALWQATRGLPEALLRAFAALTQDQ